MRQIWKQTWGIFLVLLQLPWFIARDLFWDSWRDPSPVPADIMLRNDPLWDRSKPAYMIPRESDGSGMAND